MIIARPLVAFVLLALAAAAPLRAQSTGPADDVGITASVFAPDGTVVSEGTVVIADNGRASTSIDRAGRFRLIPVRAGLQVLLITVPGFAPYRLAINVPASRSMRLPEIRLEPGAYFRVRLVSAAGEPIGAPGIRRRSFDANGNGIVDGIDERSLNAAGSEGAVAIGPLPRGVIMTLAVDNPFFAQTRLPDLKFNGGDKDVDGGTIVIQQPGAVLHVDVVDEMGAPIKDHDVYIEDTLPRSPLAFRPVRTDERGRATFERLGPGTYRVSTFLTRQCAPQIYLTAARVLPVPGRGNVETRLIAGGRAAFRITGPYGPMRGADVSAAPDTMPVLTPLGTRPALPGCPGVTDEDGRVAFTNFPPGPASVSVRTTSSTYVRQVSVSPGGVPTEVVVPDGFLPVRVLNAITHQPVLGASVTWTGEGARVEATTSITGEALLANVGAAAGTLVVSKERFDKTEASFAEPPGVLQEIAIAPAPAADRTVRPRVITSSGEAIPKAVVELIPADVTAIPRVAVTDDKGVVTFAEVPRGAFRAIVAADGFATATIQAGEDQAVEIVLMPSR